MVPVSGEEPSAEGEKGDQRGLLLLEGELGALLPAALLYCWPSECTTSAFSQNLMEQ